MIFFSSILVLPKLLHLLEFLLFSQQGLLKLNHFLNIILGNKINLCMYFIYTLGHNFRNIIFKKKIEFSARSERLISGLSNYSWDLFLPRRQLCKFFISFVLFDTTFFFILSIFKPDLDQS